MSTCWPGRCPGHPGTRSASVRECRDCERRPTRVALCQRFRGSGAESASPSAKRSLGIDSVTGVSFLAPRVPVVVVAEALPEPRLVLALHRDAADPLRGLPEVQVRYE